MTCLTGVERLRSLWGERKLVEAATLYRELIADGQTSVAIHLLGSQVAKASGDLYGAYGIIRKAMDAGPTGWLLGEVRFSLATIAREMGDTTEAVEQLQAWLMERAAYPELVPLLLGAVHYNLALALRQRRQYPDSLYHYRLACDEFGQEGLKRLHCMALQNLAWVACLTGDVQLAQGALDEAEPLCSSDYLRWHQRVGQAFIEAVASDGDRRRCMELCERIVAHEGDDVPQDVRSHANWLAGTVALELGLLEIAQRFADQALTCALVAKGENRCLSDASDLRRRVWATQQAHRPTGST